MRVVSRRSSSRGRRLAAAIAAGMALPLVVACWSAHADIGIVNPTGLTTTIAGLPAGATLAPSGVATPTPCVSPSGAPAPSALPTPVGGLPAGCPTPPVNVVPGVVNNPGTQGNGNPNGGGTGSTPTPAPTGPAALGTVAPAAPTASSTAGTSMFGGVFGLLVAPANVGIENPALRHFVLATPAPAHTAAVHSQAPSPPTFSAIPLGSFHVPGALLASVLVPSLLITVGLLVARRLVAVQFRKLIDVAAVPFGSAAAISMLLLVPKLAPSATTALTAAPATVSTAAPSVVQVAHAVPAGSAAWQQLVTIERSVADLQAQLQSSTSVATMSQDDPTLHPARFAGTTAPSAAPSPAVQLENALQAEYTFYVSTVQHNDQEEALLADAQNASADVRDVVVYDLQAVQTQLSQDAAIQSAQQSALAGTGPAPTALHAPEIGTITQGFGATSFALEPPFTFNGVTYPHFHRGIDIAAPLDTPVAAAADGVVVIAGASTDLQGNLIGYGNYVVIAHAGKLVTLYGHLDKLLVHAGQPVHAGDVIGLEGSTGNSTGPHLHFEVHLAGLLADPMQYLGTQIHQQ